MGGRVGGGVGGGDEGEEDQGPARSMRGVAGIEQMGLAGVNWMQGGGSENAMERSRRGSVSGLLRGVAREGVVGAVLTAAAAVERGSGGGIANSRGGFMRRGLSLWVGVDSRFGGVEEAPLISWNADRLKFPELKGLQVGSSTGVSEGPSGAILIGSNPDPRGR